jgi:hypothetical protein
MVTSSPQERPIPELPDDKVRDSKKNSVATEVTIPCRDPKAAEQARPPSSRKIGKRFKADEMRPAYPTTKSGWTGIGWASGTINTLDANQDVNPPTTALDLNKAAGMNGKWAISAGDALALNRIPLTMQPREATTEVRGPLNAKSKRAARLEGKDRMGVMHPPRPNMKEGMGIGRPILIRRRLATK